MTAKRLLTSALFCALLCLAVPAIGQADPLVGQWHLDEFRDPPPADGQRLVLDPEFWLTPHSAAGGADLLGRIDATEKADGRWGAALGPGNQATFVRDDTPALQPRRLTVMAWVRSDGFPGALQYVVGQGTDQCRSASYALYSGV